jgi:hypothetical protein
MTRVESMAYAEQTRTRSAILGAEKREAFSKKRIGIRRFRRWAQMTKLGNVFKYDCHSERSKNSNGTGSKCAAEFHWMLRYAQHDKG